MITILLEDKKGFDPSKLPSGPKFRIIEECLKSYTTLKLPSDFPPEQITIHGKKITFGRSLNIDKIRELWTAHENFLLTIIAHIASSDPLEHSDEFLENLFKTAPPHLSISVQNAVLISNNINLLEIMMKIQNDSLDIATETSGDTTFFLHRVALFGSKPTLEFLLKHDTNKYDDLLKSKTEEGKTPLALSIDIENTETKNYLLKYQSFVGFEFMGYYNAGGRRIFKKLLKSVQPDSLKLFFQAARHMGRPDLVMNVVQLFLESLGEVEVSAFRVADFLANIDDFHTMKYLRDKSKVNLNTTNESGETLLTKIVSSDKTPENLEKIKKLIILKADPLKKDREGQSAIDAAISNNHKDALVHFVTGDNNDEPLLIQAIKNGFSIEVISYFANTTPAIDISEAINYAIENGMDHIAESLGYILAKCDSTKSDAAFKIFYELIKLGNWIAVEFFQNKGFYINEPDENGEILITKFCKEGNLKVLGKLVDYVDIDRADSNGMTAMHHAVGTNNLKIIYCLKNAGAKCDIADLNGYGLLHVAASAGHTTLIDSLIYDYKLDPKASTKDGNTAFSLAYMNRHYSILVQLLVEHDLSDISWLKTANAGQTNPESLYLIGCYIISKNGTKSSFNNFKKELNKQRTELELKKFLDQYVTKFYSDSVDLSSFKEKLIGAVLSGEETNVKALVSPPPKQHLITIESHEAAYSTLPEVESKHDESAPGDSGGELQLNPGEDGLQLLIGENTLFSSSYE